mgnify:FL=1
MSITPQTLLRFTVGAAITAVVLFLMWYFSSIVIYILVSAVLAIMGRPLVAGYPEVGSGDGVCRAGAERSLRCW